MRMSERGIFDALQKRYPAPSIDFQWVSECFQALLDDGQQPTLEAVEEQYLFSDLAQSTTSDICSVPIPPNPHKAILFPKPTLLQITSITEIGSSAFQLQTVAEQRKDILSGQTLIRRMDDEVDDDDEEDPHKGKLPVYPRGMLRLELSAGDGRVIKAIEYRRIGELRLGETSLGAKLLIQNVRVLRGILMLEPDNTQCLGGTVDHLENDQPANFLAGLARRMGKAVPGETQAIPVTNQRTARLPPPVRHAQPVNPRARAPPPPPQASSSRARSREVQTQLPFSRSQSPDKPETNAGVRSAANRHDAGNRSPPMSARRTPRAASTAASARVTGLYHQTQLTREDYGDGTPSKRARLAPEPASRPRSSRRPSAPIQIDDMDEDDFDMEFDDSFLRQVDEVAASTNRPIPMDEVMDDTSVEYGYEFEDDDSSFIRQVEEAEARATRSRAQPVTTSRFFSSSTTAVSGNESARPKSNARANINARQKTRVDEQRPVYVIDSDGSSGKENHDPNDSDVVYISD